MYKRQHQLLQIEHINSDTVPTVRKTNGELVLFVTMVVGLLLVINDYARFLAVVAATVLLLVATRFYMIARRTGVTTTTDRRTKPCRTLVVLGSGGHTAEMLRIVGALNLKNYNPRYYVAAEGDKMSQDKAKTTEMSLHKKYLKDDNTKLEFQVGTIPRARKVLQSYFTSIFTTLFAIAHSFGTVAVFAPDLLLCNGPGTCIPLCFWAFVLNFIGLRKTTIVYVESLCRVERLSLSGLILYYSFMANLVYVQWPQLKDRYPRTRYIGRTV